MSGSPTQQQDRQIRDKREQQGDAENRHGRQIFAEHDVEIAGRNGQQQFVGPLSAFVGPNAHRDGRDEDQQDVGKIGVQLVEIRQVRVEELVRPKGRNAAEQHEHANEHVARGIAEVAGEIAAKNRPNDV